MPAPELRLRKDVTVTRSAAGLELWDRATGFRVAVDVEGANDDALDAALADVDGDLAQGLLALGLVDDGASLAEIRERQRETRQAGVDAARADRVAAYLQKCRDHAAHYKDRKDVYAGDLATLPLLRKADVRAALHDFVFDDIDVARDLESKRIGFATSSGSTGERLQVYADAHLEELPPHGLSLWGVETKGAPNRAVFTSPRCVAFECHLGSSSMAERTRGDGTLFLNSTQDPFALSRPLVEGVARELESHRPTVLMGNPVYLNRLVRAAATFGVPLFRPQLVLSSYQFLTRRTRRLLSDALGPVVDMYAASDLGAARAGIECSNGRMHAREDHVHLEFVGGDDRADGLGTAVATATGNGVMALVRYVLGDVGRFVDVDCGCALSDWSVIELHGRSKDMLHLGGTWVTARQIDDVVADVDGLDLYQIVQTGPQALQVSAVAEPGVDVDVDGLADRLRERFAVTVNVKRKDRLEPQASLKFATTRCDCAAPPELL